MNTKILKKLVNMNIDTPKWKDKKDSDIEELINIVDPDKIKCPYCKNYTNRKICFKAKNDITYTCNHCSNIFILVTKNS